MKHLKTYNQMNEEISFKGLAPILTSLIMTLSSSDVAAFGSAFGGHGGFGGHGFGNPYANRGGQIVNGEGNGQIGIGQIGDPGYNRQSSSIIQSQSRNIINDLEKMKSVTDDPQLLSLISSISELSNWQYSEGVEPINLVLVKLRGYIKSHDVNDDVINNTLDHLSKGDIDNIKSDYNRLLTEYDDISRHGTSNARSGNVSGFGTAIDVLNIILCLLLSVLVLVVGKGFWDLWRTKSY